MCLISVSGFVLLDSFWIKSYFILLKRLTWFSSYSKNIGNDQPVGDIAQPTPLQKFVHSWLHHTIPQSGMIHVRDLIHELSQHRWQAWEILSCSVCSFRCKKANTKIRNLMSRAATIIYNQSSRILKQERQRKNKKGETWNHYADSSQANNYGAVCGCVLFLVSEALLTWEICIPFSSVRCCCTTTTNGVLEKVTAEPDVTDVFLAETYFLLWNCIMAALETIHLVQFSQFNWQSSSICSLCQSVDFPL